LTSYRCYPLTDPTDGPRATVAVYDQWAAGSPLKVLVRGEPGVGDFVEFAADRDTVEALRRLADFVEQTLNLEGVA
jgi:hypothetical protein